MQTNGQWKRPKKWKVIAGVGTGAALGFAGIAFAGSEDMSGVPAPITLQRQVLAGESLSPTTTLKVTQATQETTATSPTTTPTTTATSPTTTPPTTATTVKVTRATTSHTDIDCSHDDCSPDHAAPSPSTTSPTTATTSHTDTDCSLDDCSPDSPDVTPDDSYNSIDSADSSIDS